jgi:hypothetical protein
MGNYSVSIGLDPGIKGGISIIEGRKVSVFPIPVETIIVNKKNKKIYDLVEITKILRPYYGRNVFFVQEKVSSRQGEGSVSSFSFGKSAGSTLGIATAFSFNVAEVTPRMWKKLFPELETKEIQELRKETKYLRAAAKTIKGKELKKENKKQQEKIARKIKSLAKGEARYLAQLKYPLLKDRFIKVNSDGMAESLLIAIYAKEKHGELV